MSLNTTGGLLSLPTSELCTFCPWETLNKTLSNPVTYSAPLAQLLSNAVQTCGPQFSSYNVSTVLGSPISAGPGAQFGTNATATSTSACAITGRNITASADTTCAQIAAQFSVSNNDVLVSNPFLDVSCTIPAGTQLFIPKACQTYTIATNDTCEGVAQLAGTRTGVNITTVQLQSFNPELGTCCQLMALRVGQTIFLTPNGRFPQVGTTTDANPSATPTTKAAVPTPTVDGTTSNCGKYYQVQTWDVCNTVVLNNSISLPDFLVMNPGKSPRISYRSFPIDSRVTQKSIQTAQIYDGCPSIETKFGLTNAQFIAMNAGINTGCTNLILGYTVASGDSCPAIESKFNLTLTEFIAMNPEITSTCTNLALGEAYCVQSSNATTPDGPPVNVAPGTITAGRTEYYTVVLGDSCPAIETKFSLTLPQLIAMNAEITPTCTNLALGEAYCVQSSNSTTSGPPANLATGSLANCTTYHTVVSGDTCASMDATFNITLADFLRWNPEVNTACTNILAQEAYCVGGGGSACAKVYTVKSGDSCSAILQSQGITQARLNALSPQIDDACDDLGVGENLCVRNVADSTDATIDRQLGGLHPTLMFARRPLHRRRLEDFSVSLPLELELLIIDEFDCETMKLRELCHVCRAWAAHAQSLLFRDVHLRYKNLAPFLGLIKASRLGQHISALNVDEETAWWGAEGQACVLDTIAPLLAHRMPNLHTLDISYHHFAAVQPVVQWGAVSRLHLRFCRFATTNTMVAFVAAFPRLEDLEIFQCSTLDGAGAKRGMARSKIAMPPWHLRYLALGEYPQNALIDWMVAESVDLTVDHLRILSLGPDASRFNALLAKIGGSLRHLEVPGMHRRRVSGPEVPLSICVCTVLTTLSFSERSAYDLGRGIISVLTQVVAPRLTTVEFQIHITTDFDIAWGDVEAALAARAFARLEAVVFTMWGGDARTSYDDAALLLREQLFVLAARGILRFRSAKDEPKPFQIAPPMREAPPQTLRKRLSRRISGWMGRGVDSVSTYLSQSI
ncbi:hypothetical protein DFH09DRAFT_1366804 [Mycena vulgaris]|nr:hypothetical protein DFH09DRAFT_1366804 [Mycena vulgaris]